MRILTDHIVSADLPQSQLQIEVLDEPGQGGACHEYSIKGRTSAKLPITLMDGAKVHSDGTCTVEFCRVEFQNGPIKEQGINGITQEALLAILIDRLRGFHEGPYRCWENAVALIHLEDALIWLQKRTRDRLARGVEGQNKP